MPRVDPPSGWYRVADRPGSGRGASAGNGMGAACRRVSTTVYIAVNSDFRPEFGLWFARSVVALIIRERISGILARRNEIPLFVSIEPAAQNRYMFNRNRGVAWQVRDASQEQRAPPPHSLLHLSEWPPGQRKSRGCGLHRERACPQRAPWRTFRAARRRPA